LAGSQKERTATLEQSARERDIWTFKKSKEIHIISGITLSFKNIAAAFQRISPLPQHRNRRRKILSRHLSPLGEVQAQRSNPLPHESHLFKPHAAVPPTSHFAMSASSNPNNTNSRQDTSAQRLRQLNNQLDMSSNGSVSAFGAVQQAPEDPLFGLMAAYRADKDPKKVDLGIGAYRDNNAVPWILPVVKKVSRED
jgi:hypothetical protein